jgi:hypothetical protein
MKIDFMFHPRIWAIPFCFGYYFGFDCVFDIFCFSIEFMRVSETDLDNEVKT